MSYTSRLFKTRFSAGTAYIACGNKEYLAFAVLNSGQRTTVENLIAIDRIGEQLAKQFQSYDTIYRRFKAAASVG